MSSNTQVWRQDQAAGLRRLFKPKTATTLAFVSAMPGVGTTHIMARIGMEMGKRDRQVLLVDEHCGPAGVSAALQAPYRFDLAQALTGALKVEQALVPLAEKVNLLAAVKAVKALEKDEARGRQELASRLGPLWRRQSFVLVDADVSEKAQPLSLLSRLAAKVVLVAGGGSTGVTASYLLLKRLSAAYPGLKVAVLVAKVKDEDEARGIHSNLQAVASRHLGMEPGFLGWVPWENQGRGALDVSGPASLACARLAERLLGAAEPDDEAASRTSAGQTVANLGSMPA